MHSHFGLTLMVNHACNLRCTYCYTGEKIRRPMAFRTGQAAIDRAVQSILPRGMLELGFFGGEPLAEAELILELIAHAKQEASKLSVELDLSMTTNGTLDTPAAWAVMTHPELRLAISHDGLPEIHDRHRVTIEGHTTSARVNATIERLLQADKSFRVVMVVRPDTVASLRRGMEYLYEHGVRQFDPSLDLWTTWTRADGEALKRSVRECAEFWGDRLPDCSVSWFDEKAARLAAVPTTISARCGFGYSELAVAPSGNLYPCERLIGADEPGNAMRLAGHATDGSDFLQQRPTPGKSAIECTECTLNQICSTTCRCSNYVRTGDTGRPDALLCMWDQACVFETSRVLKSKMVPVTGGVR
jgi:uncharacterized protein